MKEFSNFDNEIRVEKVLNPCVVFSPPEETHLVWLGSSPLTYLQHWGQPLNQLIMLLRPSTRKLFKGPQNLPMLRARTLHHHVSRIKGEHDNHLELLPACAVRCSKARNTSQTELQTPNKIHTNSRSEEMRWWGHYLALSRVEPHTRPYPCRQISRRALKHTERMFGGTLSAERVWETLPIGRGDDCSERIACVSWPSAASTVTQHLLPLFFPFPSFSNFHLIPVMLDLPTRQPESSLNTNLRGCTRPKLHSLSTKEGVTGRHGQTWENV